MPPLYIRRSKCCAFERGVLINDLEVDRGTVTLQMNE